MLRKLFYAVIALVSIPYLANSQGYDWNYPPPPNHFKSLGWVFLS